MTIINKYKRQCDYCEKTINKDNCVTVIKGKKHCCHTCAGAFIKKNE